MLVPSVSSAEFVQNVKHSTNLCHALQLSGGGSLFYYPLKPVRFPLFLYFFSLPSALPENNLAPSLMCAVRFLPHHSAFLFWLTPGQLDKETQRFPFLLHVGNFTSYECGLAVSSFIQFGNLLTLNSSLQKASFKNKQTKTTLYGDENWRDPPPFFFFINVNTLPWS